MPGLSGFQLAKELMHVKANSNKIVHISLISADYVIEAEEYVDNQLVKPLNLIELSKGKQYASLKFLKSVNYLNTLNDEEL